MDPLCHNRDRTYPYSPYPDLSTPIPSHQNHFRAPNAKPEPSGSIPSQLASNASPNPLTPSCLSNALLNNSNSLASSRCIPNPMHLRPFLSLASSQFLTPTLIPDLMPFDLHSFASSLFPTSHRSRDCSRVKPDRVPPSLNAS